MKNTKRIIGAVTLMASLGFVAMPAMAASANHAQLHQGGGPVA